MSSVSADGVRDRPGPEELAQVRHVARQDRRARRAAGAYVASTLKNVASHPPGAALIILIVPPGRETRTTCLRQPGDRGEYRPNARHDDVEVAVGERQRLGVRLRPRELNVMGLQPPPGRRRTARRQVAGDDVGPELRGRDRRAPAPAATSRTRRPGRTPHASASCGRDRRPSPATPAGNRRTPTSLAVAASGSLPRSWTRSFPRTTALREARARSRRARRD